jgi:hypothetical protein
MNIPWSSLGLVVLVGFAVGAVLVALFSVGVATLAGPGRTPADESTAGTGAAPVDAATPATPVGLGVRLAGYACIAVCAISVLYGIYLAVPSLHRLF